MGSEVGRLNWGGFSKMMVQVLVKIVSQKTLNLLRGVDFCV
jgi:hypothetical protein